MTNSSTGGILLPIEPPELLEGDLLLDFIQTWISNVSNLPSELVRPRWQAEPVNIPPDGITWCALGVLSNTTQEYPAMVQQNDSYSQLRIHQDISILVSMYGPLADVFISRLREGTKVSQNREYLLTQNIEVTSAHHVSFVPELIKNRWLKRVDMTIQFYRQITRNYPVKTIVSGDFNIPLGA